MVSGQRHLGKKPDFKRFSNIKKRYEIPVVTMAWRRSGVRSPYAPYTKNREVMRFFLVLWTMTF